MDLSCKIIVFFIVNIEHLLIRQLLSVRTINFFMEEYVIDKSQGDGF